jgi:hypothetical protein
MSLIYLKWALAAEQSAQKGFLVISIEQSSQPHNASFLVFHSFSQFLFFINSTSQDYG